MICFNQSVWFRNSLYFNIYHRAFRKFHISSSLRIDPRSVNEVQIPMPWGHIAGKWWGKQNVQPLLALHGWQDNAGTFDPLLELLPDSISVLAIDSPGHGLSSHYPEGMLYHNANYVMACRRIQRYFNWDNNITIMGHSEGGIIAFLFSSIYPECVNGLIALDVVKPFAPNKSQLSKLGWYIDECVTKCRRNQSMNAKYTNEEIQDRWMEGTKGSLTQESVKILMKRGVKFDQETGKYFLTRDPKLKIDTLQRFTEDQCLELARNLQCHYLSVRCSQGKFFDYSLKRSPTFISTVTESAKSFSIVNVEGTHHAHLNNPESVVTLITDFIKKASNGS